MKKGDEGYKEYILLIRSKPYKWRMFYWKRHLAEIRHGRKVWNMIFDEWKRESVFAKIMEKDIANNPG